MVNFETWSNIMDLIQEARTVEELRRVLTLIWVKVPIGEQFGLSEDD
jgi:hypothetical protein